MNIPKIRFSEFNDEWKKIQLNSFVEINPKNDSLPEQFIYIDLESVNNGLLTNRKIISKSEAPSRAQRTVKENDILYQTVRPYQMNNLFINNLDSEYPYIASTGYALLRTNENPYFVYSILYQKSFVNKVLDMCTGTSYPAISANDLGTITVSLPNIKEQEKISKTLSLLDKKIELQSRKIEDLKLFKKGLDKIIFSNQSLFDEDTIKNRFYSDGGTALEEYISNSGTHRIISIGNYSTTGTYIDNGQKIILNDKTKTKLLNKDNLVMILNDKTTTGDIIGSSILIEEDNKYIYNQRSQRLICKNINPKYAWCYLNNNNFRKHVFKLAQGGTQIYVNFSTIENQIILIPKNEQIENMIINSIIGIKDKTDKETVKLNKLIELKKGLMQCMFV